MIGHLQLDSQSKLCITYTWFRDIQHRMCNVWYMIRKGNGRQPDNTWYQILMILSTNKACDCYCHLILIDLSKNKNCNCCCYLIRNDRLKKINLFVKIMARRVSRREVSGLPRAERTLYFNQKLHRKMRDDMSHPPQQPRHKQVSPAARPHETSSRTPMQRRRCPLCSQTRPSPLSTWHSRKCQPRGCTGA